MLGQVWAQLSVGTGISTAGVVIHTVDAQGKALRSLVFMEPVVHPCTVDGLDALADSAGLCMCRTNRKGLRLRLCSPTRSVFHRRQL